MSRFWTIEFVWRIGLIVALLSVLPTAETWASAVDIRRAQVRLLNQGPRPTVAQFLEAFGGQLPAENPFRPIGTDRRFAALETVGPRLIAQLESAFPGAVFAPLGRDSTVVSDLLEAYFLARGIKDRVRRLDASTATFERTERELDFLHANGLLESRQRSASRRFVILDATSWRGFGAPSQIRRLIRSYYRSLGGPRDLERVNAIGLGVSSRGPQAGPVIEPGLRLDEFFSELDFAPYEPAKIPYVTGDLSYLKIDPTSKIEVSWHGSFGALKNSFFNPVAELGEPSSDSQREHTAWMMFETIRVAMSAEFDAAVLEHATAFGIDLRKIQGMDFRTLESDSQFMAWAGQRSWSLTDVETWRSEISRGLPPTMSRFLDQRELELIAIGTEQGAISQLELQQKLKLAVERSRFDRIWADAFAFALGRAESVKGQATLLRTAFAPDVLANREGWYAILSSPSSRWMSNLPAAVRALDDTRAALEMQTLSLPNPKFDLDSSLHEVARALTVARTPEHFIGVLETLAKQPESLSYHLKRADLDLVGRFLEMKPSLAQVDAFDGALDRGHSRLVWGPQRIWLWTSQLGAARTADEFFAALDLINRRGVSISDRSSLLSDMHRFAVLDGMTLSRWLTLESQITNSRKWEWAVAGSSVVRSESEYRRLLTVDLKDASPLSHSFNLSDAARPLLLAETVGRFLALPGATMKRAKQLENSIVFGKDGPVHFGFLVREFLANALTMSRSAEDVLVLVSPPDRKRATAYGVEVDRFIASKAERILSLPWMTIGDLRKIEQKGGFSLETRLVLLRQGAKLASSPEDLAELIRVPLFASAEDREVMRRFKTELAESGRDLTPPARPSLVSRARSLFGGVSGPRNSSQCRDVFAPAR